MNTGSEAQDGPASHSGPPAAAGPGPDDDRAIGNQGLQTERGRIWAGTMAGHEAMRGFRTAHIDSFASVTEPHGKHGEYRGPRFDPDQRVLTREAREQAEEHMLAPGATRSRGAGNRFTDEEPDELRTCFERDRDRILHSTSFRRLAGKTQVFIFPEDHQRTRLTHALEVAQVATSIASALRLNVTLAEAIALGHDCGHGPAGHASEDALAGFLPEGFDHALWGADVSLAGLNLCKETLDGIRNHSWSRPAPETPEGEVVSWADRIAYVCHDWEDAVSTGIVSPSMLPLEVQKRCGTERSRQLGAFIHGIVTATASTGRICMDEELADALAVFRRVDYENIYLRPASVTQGAAVVEVLRGLVEYFSDRPNAVPSARDAGVAAGSEAATRIAVTYVAGMTDRFAMVAAVSELGWDPARLPQGVGDWRRR
ncbi:MAG: HD domain-containing protein [Acidimicrobiales bacterium]